MTLRAIISILFITTTFNLFSQERQIENCFQTILDDENFIVEMDKAEIAYCDSTLTLIKQQEKSFMPYYFKGKKLNTNYDSSKTCSYLSFSIVSKTRLKIKVKSPDSTIGKVATGEILLFDFKVKAVDDGCKIRKVKVEEKNYHARHL